jgi:glycosyltransferase involved in cell wall biosynthesis
MSHPHIAIPLLGSDRGKSGIGHYVRSVVPVIANILERNGGRLTVIGARAELEAYADSLTSPIIATREVRALPAAVEAAWHLARIGRIADRAGADCLLLLAGNRRLVLNSPIPCVAVVHDLAQLEVAAKYDALRMFYVRRVLCSLLSKVTRLVAVSETTKDRMVTNLNLDVGDIDVVLNGIDHTRFHVDAGQAPRDREVVLDEPYILYPARLEHPGKNHERLIRAYAQTSLASQCALVFAGKDWGARTHLEAVVAELGLCERVLFLGYVSDHELPRLVASARLVAMVGLCEGFGLPAVEALACGTPLVAADAGALPEVCGGLAERSIESIAAALERVASEPALRTRVRSDGPGWAAQFSWDHAGSALVEVCREAVA